MQINWLVVMITLLLLLICCALWLVARGIYLNNRMTESLGEIQYKHGLPITPRSDRDLESLAEPADQEVDQVEADALSDMAAAAMATTQVADGDKPHIQQQVDLAQDSPEIIQVPAKNIADGFAQQSPVLDQHLNQRQKIDEEDNPFNGYEDNLTFVITPKHGTGINGRQILQIAKNYGLKYGAMNMFHRHEGEDGRGVRWFSVMAEDKNGPTVFDLNTLPDTSFISLILFLVVPHQQPLRGYDSMVSIARALAKDLNAVITDENRNLLNEEYFASCRLYFGNQAQ